VAYAMIETWQPSAKSHEILNRALEHIEGAPYQVSARWVFYRLLQDGIYNKKADYKSFLNLTSRARHSNFWSPDLLADETRSMTILEPNGTRPPDPDISHEIELAIESAKQERKDLLHEYENYSYSHSYTIDPNYYHDHICIIMFEARAMEQQFKFYAQGFTLCPFGGQPSIPYKYKIAKHLESQYQHYEKPIAVMYFGDCDVAGQSIFNTAQEDITKWCDALLQWHYCGLTMDQVINYQIPENIEHKGYQWEALTDSQAKEIIASEISKHVDIDGALSRAWRESHEITAQVETAVKEVLDREEETQCE